MEIINLSEHNSIINQFLAQLRDRDYQQNRLLFRNNIVRIGELMAYEISKTLHYEPAPVETPLAPTTVMLPTDKIVLGTIFRAGLPLHQGFLNIFDGAGNAFVSAYRYYTDEQQHNVDIRVEYMATPSLDDKVLIIADPMLATGGSFELGYKAFLTKGTPRHVHLAAVIATPEGIEHVKQTLPADHVTVWTAAIDSHLNEHQYIVPGLGDAGDLCFGEKL